MRKSLYSMVLSDEVVRALDDRARKLGTSPSELADRILAEALSVPTPERQIGEIFRAIEELTAPFPELAAYFRPETHTLSLKSSMSYRYRPTVKYEVRLGGDDPDILGELAVIFRTQSPELIAAMTDFFRYWKRLEDVYLAPLLGVAPECALYEDRFVRELAAPKSRDCTAEELAEAISGYVRYFDGAMKDFAAGRVSPDETELRYRGWLQSRPILL